MDLGTRPLCSSPLQNYSGECNQSRVAKLPLFFHDADQLGGAIRQLIREKDLTFVHAEVSDDF